MRSSRGFIAVCAAFAALSLTACSSGANSKDVHATQTAFTADSSAPSTATPNSGAVTSPAGGAVTSTDKGINFVVPGGWNLTNNKQAVAYLSSAEVANNVAPTIVISRSQTNPAPALDDVLQRAVVQARQDGQTVTTLPGRTIGGEKALGMRAESMVKNVQVTQDYYAVAHNGALYTVVLTSAAKSSKPAETALNSVLASWSWSVPGKKDSTASGTTPAPVATSTSTSAKPSSSTSSSALKSSSAPSSAGASSTSAKSSADTNPAKDSTKQPSGTSTASSTQPARSSSGK